MSIQETTEITDGHKR